MRSLRGLVLAVVLSVVLVGCGSAPWSLTAQVPVGGGIQQGDASAANREDQFIRVIPKPPHPGMTPKQIVEGFLAASAASEGDHAVAREFLSSQAAGTWDPNSGVQVFKGAPDLIEKGTHVRLVAPLAGRISETGTYEVASTSSNLNVDFHLVLEQGQWRIEQLPPGLALSTADMQRAFRPLSVYYFNPQFTTLVPDARMFPVPGDGLATGLLTGLLAGPSAWLKPAVKNAFPNGTSLKANYLGVVSGIARVDLTADALLAKDNTRLQMAQQIVWTLRQLPDVSAVSITSGGQLLTIPGVPYPIPRDEWPGIDPSGLTSGVGAVFADGTGILGIAKGEASKIIGYPDVADSTFTQVVVNRTGGMLAGVDAFGRVWSALIDPKPTWFKLPITSAIQWLEFDAIGGIWLWDPVNGLAVWDAPGPIRSIRVEGLPQGATLMKAVPSRDGTRAALILRTGGRLALYLARIEQEPDTKTRVVSGLRPVAPSASGVADVDWSSANSLAFIGRTGSGDLQAFDLDLASGVMVAQGGPQGLRSIAAAPGLPVLVSVSTGYVFQLDAGTWTSLTPGWSPSYPS